MLQEKINQKTNELKQILIEECDKELRFLMYKLYDLENKLAGRYSEDFEKYFINSNSIKLCVYIEYECYDKIYGQIIENNICKLEDNIKEVEQLIIDKEESLKKRKQEADNYEYNQYIKLKNKYEKPNLDKTS